MLIIDKSSQVLCILIICFTLVSVGLGLNVMLNEGKIQELEKEVIFYKGLYIKTINELMEPTEIDYLLMSISKEDIFKLAEMYTTQTIVHITENGAEAIERADAAHDEIEKVNKTIEMVLNKLKEIEKE